VLGPAAAVISHNRADSTVILTCSTSGPLQIIGPRRVGLDSLYDDDTEKIERISQFDLIKSW
jgi:hypothetical protein